MARPRTPARLVAAILACVGVAGCSSTPDQPVTAAPADYVSAVQSLLDPPGRLAALVAQQLRPRPGAVPAREDLLELLTQARRELADVRRLRLADTSLDRQRDRLVLRVTALLGPMRRVVDALIAGDREALRERASVFFASLRALPSAAATR
jgi:hypothetical protein